MTQSEPAVDVRRGVNAANAHHTRAGLAAHGSKGLDFNAYIWTLALVGAATLVSAAIHGKVAVTDIVMVYLLVIVASALRFGRRSAVLGSVASVAAFDFFFVPPRFTFEVANVAFMLTFGMMLVVGVVIATLAAQVRRQAIAAEKREQRTANLYGLTRDLASAQGSADIASSALGHLALAAGAPVRLLLADSQGGLDPAGPETELEWEPAIAQWTFERSSPAGAGSAAWADARQIYLPLQAATRTVGVLVIGATPQRLLEPEQRELFDMLSHQTALAIERAQLAESAELHRARAEREELRSSLLSSVSHDLRTPLAAITGAATTLLAPLAPTSEAQHDLLDTILEEATRLNRLVSNLLDMTRLESGGVQVRKEWTPLEEVIGAALNRLDDELRGRDVCVQLPADLPLVAVDGVLMQQVFFNLLENAAKHTGPAVPIEIRARHEPQAVVVEVSDQGPGFEPGSEQRLWDKFYRAPGTTAGGTGLGLTICNGIVSAHGGTISAENRPGGGALFRLHLPLGGGAPRLVDEEVKPELSNEPTRLAT